MSNSQTSKPIERKSSISTRLIVIIILIIIILICIIASCSIGLYVFNDQYIRKTAEANDKTEEAEDIAKATESYLESHDEYNCYRWMNLLTEEERANCGLVKYRFNCEVTSSNCPSKGYCANQENIEIERERYFELGQVRHVKMGPIGGPYNYYEQDGMNKYRANLRDVCPDSETGEILPSTQEILYLFKTDGMTSQQTCYYDDTDNRCVSCSFKCTYTLIK